MSRSSIALRLNLCIALAMTWFMDQLISLFAAMVIFLSIVIVFGWTFIDAEGFTFNMKALRYLIAFTSRLFAWFLLIPIIIAVLSQALWTDTHPVVWAFYAFGLVMVLAKHADAFLGDMHRYQLVSHKPYRPAI